MTMQEDHKYPLFPHPNAEFLPAETKDKTGRLIVSVFTPNIQTELIMGTFSGKKFVKDKQDQLIFHGVTDDEVALFDAIVTDMMKSNSKFLKGELNMVDTKTDEGFGHYAMAMKAAIQYYLYEPFIPEEVLTTLRDANMLYPKTAHGTEGEIAEL